MSPLSKYEAGQSGLLQMEQADRETCLRLWRETFGREPQKHISLRFMRRALIHEEQCKMFGGLSSEIKRAFKQLSKVSNVEDGSVEASGSTPAPGASLRPGTHLVREWNGRTYQVEVVEGGFVLDGKTYGSLSAIAKKITGTHWSGPRFFGLGRP